MVGYPTRLYWLSVFEKKCLETHFKLDFWQKNKHLSSFNTKPTTSFVNHSYHFSCLQQLLSQRTRSIAIILNLPLKCQGCHTWHFKQAPKGLSISTLCNVCNSPLLSNFVLINKCSCIHLTFSSQWLLELCKSSLSTFFAFKVIFSITFKNW